MYKRHSVKACIEGSMSIVNTLVMVWLKCAIEIIAIKITGSVGILSLADTVRSEKVQQTTDWVGTGVTAGGY